MQNVRVSQLSSPTNIYGRQHAPSSSSGHTSYMPPQELSQFGSLPAHVPWTEDVPASSSQPMPEVRISSRVGLPPSGPSAPMAFGEGAAQEWQRVATTSADYEQRCEQNRKRTASRDFKKPYLKEMAAAHAQNRDPIIEIPVSNEGTVLGLKSPWHRAARLCARQTLNFKVRSYKGRREYWISQVECIAEKLAHKFTYTKPLDIKYLAKFLKNCLKNDRKCWKAYFISNSGLRHPSCPVEAFTEWKKHWVSAAGREESINMAEMRKGKNKSQRTSSDPIPNEQLTATGTPRAVCSELMP